MPQSNLVTATPVAEHDLSKAVSVKTLRASVSVTLTLGLAFALLLAYSTSARAENPVSKLPDNFQVQFQASAAGAVVGELSMKLSRSGADYALQSVATPKGLAVLLGDGRFSQESLFGIKSGRVLPFRYNERRKKRGRPPEWTLDFNWNDMQVTMPDGSRIPMPNQPVDPAVVSIQMMLTPPSSGRDLVVHLVNDRGVRKHTFSLIGEESIETAVGTVKAWHLRQRKHGADERSYIDIWISPENWNIPIRMQRHKKGRVITFDVMALDVG